MVTTPTGTLRNLVAQSFRRVARGRADNMGRRIAALAELDRRIQAGEVA